MSNSEIPISKNYFSAKGKNAESFLYELSKKSFFVDWCYLNPLLPDGKELCDLLIVFDEIAIIWQIKDLKPNKDGGIKESDFEKNIKQLSGARRTLFDLKTPIKLNNPRRGEEIFNPEKIKEIYLIAVFIGDFQSSIPLIDSIKKYLVHIFIMPFLEIVLNELDTITDFIEYLRCKEKFITSFNQRIITLSGEEDFLGLYLLNDRNLDKFNNAILLTVADDIWKGFSTSENYNRREKADKKSYFWDNLINRAHEAETGEYEIIARELARLNRFERRLASNSFIEAHLSLKNDPNKLFKRTIAIKGVSYCFLFAGEAEKDIEERKNLLFHTCMIVRMLKPENKTVIGISTSAAYGPTFGYEFFYINIPELSQSDIDEIKQYQNKLGIYTKPEEHFKQEWEYPKDKS